MSCINFKHPEIIKMAEELNVSPAVLAAKVGVWQTKNNINDRFPTIDELNQSNQIINDDEENNSKIDFNKFKGSKKNELDWNNISEDIIQEGIDLITKKDYTKEHNRILFNNKQGKITVDEILENILNNFNNLSPKGKELLEKSRRLVGRNGAKFQFVAENQLISKDTLMQVNGFSNTIQINRDRIKRWSPEVVIEGFIHELAHAQTLQALINPQTFEEKEFKKLIDKYYFLFISKSSSVKSYGFTNEKEFVAEIYSNPEFRKELRSIDIKNKYGFWKQFLDAVRRLFGMTKNQETNDLIDSVINFVESDRRDYQGLNSQKQLIFEKKEDFKKIKIESIEDKLTYTLNKAKDNLDNLLKRSKTFKKNNETKGKDFEKHIQELISEIEKADKINQWKGISVYVKSMLTTANQLTERLNKEDLTKENGLELIQLYQGYLSSYDLSDDVKKLITDLTKDEITEVNKEDINEIKSFLTEAIGVKSLLESSFSSKMAEILKTQLNTLHYLPQIEDKWVKSLSLEYNQKQITGISKTEWISQQMNTTYKEDIQKDLDNYINDLFYGIGDDISSAAVTFLDVINNNSRLVSIVMKLITDAREKSIEQTRDADFKDKVLFDKLVKEKGSSTKPSEFYKNMFEFDSNGKGYYKGEYSLEFKNTLNKLRNKRKSIFNEKGIDSSEYKAITKKYRAWLKENTINVKGVKKPVDKWKTDYSKLSKVEKEVLKSFIDTIKSTNEKTHGYQSLIETFNNVEYYRLPAITISNLERVLEGKVKGIVQDKWKDLTSVRPDDIGYVNKRTNDKGEILNYQKVHYRGDLLKDEQSLDLFTITRLERVNGINYEQKNNILLKGEAVKMIAKNKKYYTTESGGKYIQNMFNERQPQSTINGENSNTYKMIENLIEKNIYDIMNVNYGQLGPLDVNKVVTQTNAWLASVGMSLNAFSASANILNAQAQIFLERIAGNHLTKGSVRKAHAYYTKDLPNIASDYGNPIKTSFVNQVNQIFDTFGGFSVKQQEYIKNTIAKTAVNFQSLQFMHEGGEHYVQSVMVMATLESIKVMNSNNQFINKDGKVVTEDKAVSMLDMLEKNENGKLTLSDKAVYTNRSLTAKMNEGGKQQIMLFVKKKLFDTMGNYDSNMQPEAYRHWWGKLTMLFRRYLIPQMYVRYRGISKAFVKEEDLLEKDIIFSDALRTTEEGSYVSTIRFLIHGVFPELRRLKFDIISSNWDKLDDNKKAGIKKTAGELALIASLMLIGILASGAAGDDDDSYLWTVAFLARRLQSELSQFRDPREATKITKSPIPSLRIVEQTLDVFAYTLPWNWSEINDTYETGKRKGDLKVVRKIEKLVPVLKNTDVTSQELFNYLDSNWGK